MSLYEVFSLAHLVGLALGVGASTVKLTLVIKCTRDRKLAALFVQISTPVTRVLVLGLILLTLSGIGWLWLGFPLTLVLRIKLGFVVALWVVGLTIDRVVEPRFRAVVPMLGGASTPASAQALKRYVMFEALGTGLFWLITVLGTRV